LALVSPNHHSAKKATNQHKNSFHEIMENGITQIWLKKATPPAILGCGQGGHEVQPILT
jgi:hypothetical protein